MTKSQKGEKIKRLLWCKRHCCLCKKACGLDIEFAHLPGKEGSKDVDDQIPVCFECHSRIGAYNDRHPKGTKYKAEELIESREQVYDEETKSLVPPIFFEITQVLPNGKKRQFPDVGFNIIHRGLSLPVNVLVRTDIFSGKTKLPNPGGHYSGEKTWSLNPGMGYNGHFEIKKIPSKAGNLKISVQVTVIDCYDRRHKLLPVSWIFNDQSLLWFSEP